MQMWLMSSLRSPKLKSILTITFTVTIKLENSSKTRKKNPTNFRFWQDSTKAFGLFFFRCLTSHIVLCEITSNISGCMCPMTGLAAASKIRGGTLDGPGPNI